MMGWISVNDRMPPAVGDYLCAFDDGTVQSFDYTDLDIYRGYWGYQGIPTSKVTHWMPLPDPPGVGK